jgi:hypothetical protein
MERYLPMPTAMELAGIKSRNTMKRLIMEGIVQAERLPSASGRGHWRIAESSIMSLLGDATRQKALALIRGIRI